METAENTPVAQAGAAQAPHYDRYWRILIVLSLVFCVFHLFLHSRAPVHDGDSFEYVGIARSIFETGHMREDILRTYTIKDQPLPHPPALRANLYVYFLVPFYAVFRTSQWSFLVPSFIGLFLLPLVTYRVGRRMFTAETGFIAALLTMLSPSVLRQYTFMDPGLPEVWQMMMYLFFILMLVEERYIVAGLLMGLAFSFKRNSIMLIPSALVWLALFRRRQLFGVPALKLFAAAGLLVAPFLLRAWLLFGSPLYTEQFMGVSRAYSPSGTVVRERFDEGDLFGIIFNYVSYNEAPPPVENPPMNEHLDAVMQVIRTNTEMVIFGRETGIFYQPGIFQAFGFLLFPFFILGLLLSRLRPDVSLAFLIVCFQIALHTGMAIYSDRYLLCVMPLVFLVAAQGMRYTFDWLKNSFSGVNSLRLAMGLVVFVLVSDSMPALVFNAVRTLQPARESRIAELETTCDYLKRQTEPGDAIMTYPFFSTHFVCDRPTGAIPWGDMRVVAEVIRKYDMKHLIYTKVWPGDLFPDLPFADRIARGDFISLFRIDPGRLEEFLDDPQQHYLHSLNLSNYFLSNRFNFEISPPVYKLISKLTHSAAAGTIIYLLLAVFFVFSYNRRGFTARILPVAAIILFFLFLVVWNISVMFEPFSKARPQVSKIQAELFLPAVPEQKREILMVAETAKNAPLVESDLSPFFEKTLVVPELPEIVPARTTVFLPVPPVGKWLGDEYDFAASVEIQKARIQAQREFIEQYESDGYRAEPVYGGVFVY